MTRLYAAMETALWVLDDPRSNPSTASGDGEWTVTERLADRRLRCLDAAPSAPNRVFCGTFDDGLHRSIDGGEKWKRVGESAIESDRVTAVAVDPHDSSTVWVGTEPSAVYRSTDGGDSWERRAGLLDLPSASEWFYPPRPDTHHVRWIEPDPHQEGALYVGIELGALVLTDDGGETWRERPPGSRRDNHSLTTHPDAPGWVWTAAGDGYAESHDSGRSWAHPQAGLDHRYCWSVAVDVGKSGGSGRSGDSSGSDDPGTVLVSSASGARSAHSLPAESYVYRHESLVSDDPEHEDGRERRNENENEQWERAMDGLPDPQGLIRAELASGDTGEFFALTNRGLFRSADTGRSWAALELNVEWPASFEERAPHGLLVV